MCVNKRESSETEAVALVECDEREVICINRHKYPPSAAISSRVSHTKVLRRYDGFPSIAGLTEGGCDQSLEWIKACSSLHSKRSVIAPLWIHSGFSILAHGKTAPFSLHLNVIRD